MIIYMEAKLFWNNVNAFLKDKGLTQGELCKECGLNLASFRNRISKERWPQADEAIKIAKFLKVTVEELAGEQSTASKGKVPLFDQFLSAGHGQFVPEYDNAIEHITLPESFNIKDTKDISALRIRGDSMEPTVRDGDIVFIQTGVEYEGEGIYAIRYHGDGFLKRLSRDSKDWIIISDNKLYETMKEPLQSLDISVIGKIIGCLHMKV
ncbi:MAG: LexA family transcriptional regulator [Treponema sp.]|nr:LexA family transcriptional regulator [Treponema sp.]